MTGSGPDADSDADDADDRPLAESLENRLMGQGIYLERWERTSAGIGADGDEDVDGDRVVLEYDVVADAPTVTSDEVGTVVRTLLSVADERDDWTPATLEVASRTTDGDRRGTWRVEADWLRRLGDDLSEVEFSRRVLETIDRSP